MKTFTLIKRSVAAIGACTLALAALAQTPPAGKTLAASAGVIAYPAKGQKPEQQTKDEAECYNWSKQQSGYDPLSPPPAAQPAQATGPVADGSRARGAVRGAAAGAVIGEIADNDAGKGAAIGAAAGAMAGGQAQPHGAISAATAGTAASNGVTAGAGRRVQARHDGLPGSARLHGEIACIAGDAHAICGTP